MSETKTMLLDVTRLISRSWTGRHATGIDRVCYAYLDHYADQAQAVVQHRGMFRIMNREQSAELYDLLRGPVDGFNLAMAGFIYRNITRAVSRITQRGAVYLNVSHTDFDLESHWRWTRSNHLRPVYLIHDLIPIDHAHHCRPRAVERHIGRVSKAIRSAAGIIVNSRATASDLTDFAGNEGGRLPPVLVAPLAGAQLQPKGARALGQQRYFLCLGTIEPRKNHRLLLAVWRRILAERGSNVPQLVCIGQWGAGSDEVRAALAADPLLAAHVTMINDCPDADLADWIAGAEALLLPSEAEGFGLPLVEALGLGTPVIASDLPCFRENGQGIPRLLDPHAVEDWEKQIMRLWSDPAERLLRRVQAMGFQAPSWSGHFARLDDWLARVVRKGAVRLSAGSGELPVPAAMAQGVLAANAGGRMV